MSVPECRKLPEKYSISFNLSRNIQKTRLSRYGQNSVELNYRPRRYCRKTGVHHGGQLDSVHDPRSYSVTHPCRTSLSKVEQKTYPRCDGSARSQLTSSEKVRCRRLNTHSTLVPTGQIGIHEFDGFDPVTLEVVSKLDRVHQHDPSLTPT